MVVSENGGELKTGCRQRGLFRFVREGNSPVASQDSDQVYVAEEMGGEPDSEGEARVKPQGQHRGMGLTKQSLGRV